MEDSIQLSSIHNRKVIFEVRYKPNPSFVDVKGQLVEKLVESNVIQKPHWELGISEIRMSDSSNATNCRKIIYADMHRLSIINSKKMANDSLFGFITKTYNVFKEVVKKFHIIRIGCRIQGTYKCCSNDYKTIVDNFIKMFPSQILLEDYNIKDFRFNLIYQNGQYHVGPVTADDSFIKGSFQYDDAEKSAGFAIDTDNYMAVDNDDSNLNDSNIENVFLASFSVEKSLFEKFATL